MHMQSIQKSRKDLNYVFLGGLKPEHEFDSHRLTGNFESELLSTTSVVNRNTNVNVQLSQGKWAESESKCLINLISRNMQSLIIGAQQASQGKYELNINGPTVVSEIMKSSCPGKTEIFNAQRLQITTPTWSLVIRGTVNTIDFRLMPTTMLSGLSKSEEVFEPFLKLSLCGDENQFAWFCNGSKISLQEMHDLMQDALAKLVCISSSEFSVPNVEIGNNNLVEINYTQIQNNESEQAAFDLKELLSFGEKFAEKIITKQEEITDSQENYTKTSQTSLEDGLKFSSLPINKLYKQFRSFSKTQSVSAHTTVTHIFNNLVKDQAIYLKTICKQGAQVLRKEDYINGEILLREAEFAKLRLDKIASLRARFKQLRQYSINVELALDPLDQVLTHNNMLWKLQIILGDIYRKSMDQAANSFEKIDLENTRESINYALLIKEIINELETIDEHEKNMEVFQSHRYSMKEQEKMAYAA